MREANIKAEKEAKQDIEELEERLKKAKAKAELVAEAVSKVDGVEHVHTVVGPERRAARAAGAGGPVE